MKAEPYCQIHVQGQASFHIRRAVVALQFLVSVNPSCSDSGNFSAMLCYMLQYTLTLHARRFLYVFMYVRMHVRMYLIVGLCGLYEAVTPLHHKRVLHGHGLSVWQQ